MRPTLRTVWLLGAGVPVALLPVLIAGRLWPFWLVTLAASLLAVGADAVLALPRRRLAVTVDTPPLIHIGEPEAATIALTAAGWRRRVAADLVADLDDELRPQPAQSLLLAPGAPAHVEVALEPRRRGQVELRGLHVRWTGPFGLVALHKRVHVGRRVPVVPNVRAVRRAALSFWARDALQGLKVERFVGDGSEFESLREHVPGLDHRAIDWKHSARHRRLVSKEFRAERNHHVVIAIDTGALMREPLDGVPKLDHAIGAGLLLGYFSLRGGDRVGLYGFDAQVRLFAEPSSGLAAFPRLQHAAAELAYSTAETNYTLGLSELATRLRRRSLIVLLTDFVDTVTAELMIENVQRLASRHLVVFVTLRDPGLGRLVAARPHELGDVYRAVVAGDMIRERETVMQRLRRRGIHCLDAPPARIGIDVVNRYLEIKRRELV